MSLCNGRAVLLLIPQSASVDLSDNPTQPMGEKASHVISDIGPKSPDPSAWDL